MTSTSTLEHSTPDTAEGGYDLDYTGALYDRFGPPLARLFRFEVSGLDNVTRDRPCILASNHNAGGWGILDVMFVYHIWHNLLHPDEEAPLSAISEDTVFDIPGLGTIARKTGLRRPDIETFESCLEAGHAVYVTPGANVDMLRPIWKRNQTRFQDVVFVGSRRVFRDQLWYIDTALRLDIPIYPIAISGTHKMTPILWESPRILRWSGIPKLRANDEPWSGFPITLNHFLNAGLFSLTPVSNMAAAWLAFLAANVYLDFTYFYPLFPFQVKIHVGEPVRDISYEGADTVRERKKRQRQVHEHLVSSVNHHLERLD